MDHHMEILKSKMNIKNDDLNDAEMLMDYAEMSKGVKDNDAALWFHKRAKVRWGQYEEDERAVESHIEKMKENGKDAPDSVQAAMLEMLTAEFKSHACRVKHRVENFFISA